MSPATVKRKLAAILAADAVGYSRLMGADEESALRVLTAHRSLIDSVIRFHNGRVIDTAGDSVLAEFASAVEAVRCAVEVQDALRTRNESLPEAQRMEFRIGVNLGDVMERDGNLFGDGVNVAARLESISQPGGVCISSSIYDQISGKLNMGFVDIGEQSLKNISRPVRAYRVVGSGALTPGAKLAPGRKRPRRPWLALAGLVVALAAAGAWYATWRSAPPPAKPAPAPAPRVDRETLVWESVRDSDDPAQLQAYLNQYPNGLYAALAKARLARLEAAAAKRTEEAKRAEEARAKSEAEAAHLKAEAEAARKEAAAARAAAQRLARQQAQAQKRAAEQVAKAAAAVQRYDGQWNVLRVCEPFKGNPEIALNTGAMIRKGEVVIERRPPGQPGHLEMRGTVAADGSLTLSGTQIVGFGRLRGTPLHTEFSGRFSNDSFETKGFVGMRPCTISMKRRGS